jgi:hypothetical protein
VAYARLMPLTKPQLIFGFIVGTGVVVGLLQLYDFPWWLDHPFVTFLLTIWLFDGGIHAKGRIERGESTGFLDWIWAPGVVVVIWLDIVFNLTWGWIIFRERPQWEDREFLFSARVQRHVDRYNAFIAGPFRDQEPTRMMRRRFKSGIVWGRRLNRIDENHIRHMPSAATIMLTPRGGA